MTPLLHRWLAESAPARRAGAGSPAPDVVSPALEVVREWAPAPFSVILSGSHAAGSAVWVEHEGRAVSLSDLDLYVVLGDEEECRAASARRCAALSGLPRRALAFGLAAPLEAGFLPLAAIARLPARPGTIELARHGRVVMGDARGASLVPRFEARDVSREEVALLLENRGCELLWCRPRLASSARLARLQGRHSVLKCALDLAGVSLLLRGEYPDGHAARVARARELRAASRDEGGEAAARGLDRLWDAALAWRQGSVADLPVAEAEAEWTAAVRGWAAAWWEVSARLLEAAPAAPAERALAVARRARLRSRLREALTGSGGAGSAPRAGFARALGGTLRHRVHATAALLLLAARDGAPGAIPGPTRAALDRLGVAGAAAGARWEDASRAVARAWDRWLLDGQRTADPA